jgi:hypothetical protein
MSALLAEIIEHFARNDWRPSEHWAMPDDGSSLCFECDLPDGTKFWLDIDKDEIAILWRPPGEEARTLRLAAQRLEAKPESEAQIARVARAIGRTGNELDEGCDEPCDTDGGTCICIDLHWDQARAALKAAREG